MRKSVPSYPSLSAYQSEILHAILYGPSKGAASEHQGSVRPITEKFVDKYVRFFNGDAAEIESICHGAALDAVTTYAKKPPKEVYAVAVRMMVNRILNAAKALSRKKRGSEYRHLSLTISADRVSDGDDFEQRNKAIADSRSGLIFATADDSPLDRAIAVQIAEREMAAPTKMRTRIQAMLLS